MLLNGWKEIATYLKCGVRTVQRWEHLGLPVMRVRGSKKGPVMAVSEKLDAWVRNRSFVSDQRNRPDVAANIERASALLEIMTEHLRTFLSSELASGHALASRALEAGNAKNAAHYRALARQAYDTVTRFLSRTPVPEQESKQFKTELEKLKGQLRELGERF